MSIKTNDNSQVTLESDPIKEVEKFVCLVSEISKDGDIRKIICIRYGQGGSRL